MEDGEAVEIVQQAIAGGEGAASFLAMGGVRGETTDHLVSEVPVIGFWEYYQQVMDL